MAFAAWPIKPPAFGDSQMKATQNNLINYRFVGQSIFIESALNMSIYLAFFRLMTQGLKFIFK